jgi:hypothetical protein
LLSYFHGLKTATKRITALLFTLLGFAPLLFIILTGIKQQEIRQSMRRRLESNMLHTITIAKKDVRWLKDGKEILVDGRMFDIKSSKSADNGKISFTGLYDDEETTLVKKISKNQQNENNTGGKLLAQLFQLLCSSFNHSPEEIFIPSLNSNHFPVLEQRLPSRFKTILSPPPQAS